MHDPKLEAKLDKFLSSRMLRLSDRSSNGSRMSSLGEYQQNAASNTVNVFSSGKKARKKSC